MPATDCAIKRIGTSTCKLVSLTCQCAEVLGRSDPLAGLVRCILDDLHDVDSKRQHSDLGHVLFSQDIQVMTAADGKCVYTNTPRATKRERLCLLKGIAEGIYNTKPAEAAKPDYY
jgi:hypothetical protein